MSTELQELNQIMWATIWILLFTYRPVCWQLCCVLFESISGIIYTFGACEITEINCRVFTFAMQWRLGATAHKMDEGGKSVARTTTSFAQTGFLTKTVTRRWLMAGMRPDQMRHPRPPPQPMRRPRTGVVAPDEPVQHLSRHTPPVASWLRFVAQLWKSQNNWSLRRTAPTWFVYCFEGGCDCVIVLIVLALGNPRPSTDFINSCSEREPPSARFDATQDQKV